MPRAPKDEYWSWSSSRHARAHAREVARVLAALESAPRSSFDPENTIMIAPSGWICDQWTLGDAKTPPPGARAIDHDAHARMKDVADFALDQLGRELSKIPAAYVAFGVDLHRRIDRKRWWELQALLVYERRSESIVARTTKLISGAGSERWLYRDKRAKTHFATLGPFGRTMLLNCHDLASLSGRGLKNAKDEERRELQSELLMAARSQRPETLIHIGHTLGAPTNWRNKLSNVIRKVLPEHGVHVKRAMSVARDEGDAPLKAYRELARGVRDFAVLID